MAFTDPRTWTTNELVTAAIMNTYIRDNQNALNAGKESAWLPSSAWNINLTSGAGSGSAEPTAGRAAITFLAFDSAADEFAQIELAMPLKWGLGTISYIDKWTASASSGTTGVAFGLRGVARADGETQDGAAFGTGVVVQDDRADGAYNHYSTPESTAVTIDGTPADGDAILLEKYRDVSDGNDDMLTDALWKGMLMFYTTDQRFEA